MLARVNKYRFKGISQNKQKQRGFLPANVRYISWVTSSSRYIRTVLSVNTVLRELKKEATKL